MDPASVAQVVKVAALVVILLMVVIVLVQSGLITLIYRGSNWARIVSMSLSAIATIAAAVDYFNGGRQVVLYANLLGLPLDILVLLALSSMQASAWTRRIRYLRLRRRHHRPQEQ
jgi:hypothetical protein